MSAPLGNKYAARGNRSQIVGDALRRVAKQNPKRLRAMCEKLLSKAEEGDVQAFKEFRDSLDGKPMQAITGSDGGPIQVRLSKKDIDGV